MKQLRDQLKSKSYSNIYLFYGEEKYLIDVYVKRYVDSIFEGQDKMMNFDQFNLDNKDVDKMEMSLETLPFFADKRVVLLDNLDLFNKKNKKKAERIIEKLKCINDTNICIVVEDKIDKRNKLYKLCQKEGLVQEFRFLGEKELIQYVARELKKNNLLIGSSDAKYFIETVGYELRIVSQEVSKLIDYGVHEDVINRKHIDDVCTKHLESKIFDLVDAVGLKNREKALLLYQDMISLREPATRILFMISRQITLIFQMKLLSEKRVSMSQIAKELKVPDFVARKIENQSRQFTKAALKEIITDLVELEHGFKSGRMNIETGIELLILKLSKK